MIEYFFNGLLIGLGIIFPIFLLGFLIILYNNIFDFIRNSISNYKNLKRGNNSISPKGLWNNFRGKLYVFKNEKWWND